MTKSFSLKDQLFNRQTVTTISQLFKQANPAFNTNSFIESTLEQFPTLELKERITCIANQLHTQLPTTYEAAITVLLQALPPKLDPKQTDNDFGQFIVASYSEFVAIYGCNKKQYETSIHALKEITKRFSVEYAMRNFINAFPTETLAHLQQWATDSNYHVRRAVSESTRPRLPWGKNICYTAEQTIPLLRTLHADNTRFVTRSVANHLNDYSKTDPALVLRTLQQWQSIKKQDPKELAWITKHSLRTLVKQGHIQTLNMLGYNAQPVISIRNFMIHTPNVRIGEGLEFSFNVLAQQEERLMIDYSIEYQTKSGTLRPKVFKISQDTLLANEQKMYTKKVPFKPMTTKKLYEGTHTVHIQINGNVAASGSFMLTAI